MSARFQLLQAVRVCRDLPEQNLKEGMSGTVVDLLRGDGEAYEVEVVDEVGRTVFLGPLADADIEPASAQT